MAFIDKLEKAYKKIQGEQSNRFYHGSPNDHGDVLKVLPYGKNGTYGHDFGGIFLSKEKWGHIGKGKNYWYYIDLKGSEILTGNDLYYRHDPKEPKISKALDFFDLLDLSEDDFDIMWDALCDRKVVTKALDFFGDSSEWQIQTIQGQIAKALGYTAFKSPDERGVAYLLIGPNSLKKDQ